MKTIITVAINGSEVQKTNNINVPITIDEIVSDAYECYLNGASIVHIHTRCENGHPCIDLKQFAEIKKRLNAKCDILVNFSTSGEYQEQEGLKIIGSFDGHQSKRKEVVSLKPDIASIDLATTNFGERIFLNPSPFLNELLVEMNRQKVVPEFEIFNPGDIKIVNYLRKTNNLSSEHGFYQIVLGTFSGSEATVEDLVFIKNALPKDCTWSAFGIGKNHLRIMFATLALGGHLRVGLEDNIYYRYKVKATNVELVKRAARVVREFGNEVANPKDAKLILNIK